MDPRPTALQQLAAQLRQELGATLDSARMATDARYARDVLLVCDAMIGTALPGLARLVRATRAAPATAVADQDHTGGAPGATAGAATVAGLAERRRTLPRHGRGLSR